MSISRYNKIDVDIPMSKPLKFKDGREMSGDEILLSFEKFCRKFRESRKQAVPIAEQNFVNWLTQYKQMRDEGKTPKEILELTVSAR